MPKTRFSNQLKKVMSIILAGTLVLSILMGASAISAPSNIDTSTWEDKISHELREVMEEVGSNELIPVWIYQQPVDEDIITEALIEENGMDPAVYEDEDRFYNEIAPDIVKEVEDEVGYEKAHRAIEPEQITESWDSIYSKDGISNGIVFDDAENESFEQSISLAEKAVHEEMNEYLQNRRTIVKQEYSAVNDQFIEEHIEEKERQILYNSRYTSTIIVEATKSEIVSYAKMAETEEVALYEKTLEEPQLNISLGQVKADGISGTKSEGYKGTGVKIGILEVKGRYDSTAIQLSGLGARLQFVNNNMNYGTSKPYAPVPYSVSNHATMVTCLIVGKSVTSGSNIFEGMAPGATVFQMPVQYSTDVLTGIQQLVDIYDVDVINYSGGSDQGNIYSDYDREVDTLISNTGIVFINSAGNEGNKTGNITSPGKALNAITVGNAETKSDYNTALSQPYNIAASSSFIQPDYITNKPDIAAPGTAISYIVESGYINYDSGTSYAAPLVAGAVAQLIQISPWLKGRPMVIKALLTTGANNWKLNASGVNGYVSGNGVMAAGGAGLLNVSDAVNNLLRPMGVGGGFAHFSVLENQTGLAYQKKIYLFAGQLVRIALAFGKDGNSNITSLNQRDDLDISLVTESGTIIGSRNTTADNLEILQTTISATGTYYIRVTIKRNIDFNYSMLHSVAWSCSGVDSVFLPVFIREETRFGTYITMCATTGDIYYTTDGTMPTVKSTKYTGPILLNSTTTFRAISVVNGVSSPSRIETFVP